MPSAPNPKKLGLADFILNCRDVLVSVPSPGGSVAFFSSIAVDEKELQWLVFSPASVLPPRVADLIPNLRIVLVPYLQQEGAGTVEGPRGPCYIAFETPPASSRCLVRFEAGEDEHFLFLGIEDETAYADAHVLLYSCLAEQIIERLGDELMVPFVAQVRSELQRRATGEVNEEAWALKDALVAKDADTSDDSQPFRDYAMRALQDTLALYMHGLCCDIELEGGPKRLSSQHLRTRLSLVRKVLPGPPDVALFPEELPLGRP